METTKYTKKSKRKNEFKSYYVVWKQKIINKQNNNGKRLNRTMQYGNRNFDNIDMHFILGLNRTMQYGNNKTKWQNAIG